MSPSEAPITPEVEADLRIAKRGCDELLVESEFARKLAKSRATGVPLRIKLGLDPTAPDIHLGHTVVLNKMRQLQDLGHNHPPAAHARADRGQCQDLLRAGQPGAGPGPHRDPLQLRMVRSAGRSRHDPAGIALHRGPHDGTRGLHQALQGRHSDFGSRIPVSADAGL
ncbi:hypothetical protein G6F59_014323 [Rhizopus arrhizus]|nr:hypothetical protein G6F59_014323 [Rhizopus arrhizus]